MTKKGKKEYCLCSNREPSSRCQNPVARVRANPRQCTGITECILSGMIRDRTFHRSHQASRCIQRNKAEGDWMESSFSNHNVCSQKGICSIRTVPPVNHNFSRYVGEFPRLLKDAPAPRLSGECPWQSLPQKTKLLRAGVSLDRARAVGDEQRRGRDEILLCSSLCDLGKSLSFSSSPYIVQSGGRTRYCRSIIGGLR